MKIEKDGKHLERIVFRLFLYCSHCEINYISIMHNEHLLIATIATS